MKNIVLSLMLVVTSFAEANNLIKPSLIQVDRNSGQNLEGIYKTIGENDDGTFQKKLVIVEVKELYNETVLTYENIQPGKYAYRFSKISKKGVKPSSWSSGEHGGCNSDPISAALDEVKQSVLTQTENLDILSKKDAAIAEIRLTAKSPEKTRSSGEGYVLAIDCGNTSFVYLAQWELTARPSTDWKKIIVKSARTLVLRMPESVYKKSKFELVKLD